MPYKDKVLQREAVAKAVKKHRESITGQSITDNKRNETIKTVTESPGNVTANVTPYHPILKYLIHEKKVDGKLTNRQKMEEIVSSLSNHKQLDNVSYGIGKHSLPMTMVGDLLDATA